MYIEESFDTIFSMCYVGGRWIMDRENRPWTKAFVTYIHSYKQEKTVHNIDFKLKSGGKRVYIQIIKFFSTESL